MNQRAQHPALGRLNTELGEFWLNNPWQNGDHNLSAFERNRVLLNLKSDGFADVSHLTSADLEADSRGVTVGDFTGDGMPDLVIRSVGGGPLKIFENKWPKKSWMRVSLRGTKSNAMGLGAKLKFEVGKRTIWRELYPVCSYQSQLPPEVQVGLADDTMVEKLTIFWPSGTVQKFHSVPANRHVRISEGADGWADYSQTRPVKAIKPTR